MYYSVFYPLLISDFGIRKKLPVFACKFFMLMVHTRRTWHGWWVLGKLLKSTAVMVFVKFGMFWLAIKQPSGCPYQLRFFLLLCFLCSDFPLICFGFCPINVAVLRPFLLSFTFKCHFQLFWSFLLQNLPLSIHVNLLCKTFSKCPFFIFDMFNNQKFKCRKNKLFFFWEKM